MGAVNFVTTIFWMRAPGMTFFRMPVFVWSVLSAQLLQLINLPSLTAALILLLLDLSFGTQFFKPDANGDPIIYQHLFWFYSHPAVVYHGATSLRYYCGSFAAFSRNPLFGYRSVALATLGYCCSQHLRLGTSHVHQCNPRLDADDLHGHLDVSCHTHRC